MAKIASEKIKPNAYVYMAFNMESDEFYFGFRCANKISPENDIGVKYFSSAKYVSDIKEKFDWIVLDEFQDADSAYFREQQYIHKHWGNPKLLNRAFNVNGKIAFRPTEESSRKISLSRIGKPSWNSGIKTGTNPNFKSWNKGKTKEDNESIRIGAEKLVGRSPWTKGLTKETDERIAASAAKTSASKMGHVQSEITKQRISKSSIGKHVIRCSCILCRTEYDYGNYCKHIVTDCKNIDRTEPECSCIRCGRVIKLATFKKLHANGDCKIFMNKGIK